jgi:tetratricopeptide (TPR) repeat protein/TM2 domain-containing membrane protein YozV
MLRRFIPALFAIVGLSATADANLLDSWQEVQANLVNGDVAGAELAIAALQEEAVELEIRRMPDFAAALATWAEEHPGAEGEAMLRAARQLDPDHPKSYFLAAQWYLGNGATVAAVKESVVGLIALVKFESTRRAVIAGLLMWIVIAIVVTLFSMILVVTVRYLRGVVFDARDLGGRVFRPANAWVFAVVLLMLPLFAALGPVWLAVYLFVLSWPYLSQVLRIWAFLACLALALVGPTFAWIEHDVLQSESLMNRVGTMFDERQADFATLREFSELAPEFEEVSDYHLLLGELLRMHGEPGMARVEFQKATLLDAESSRPLVFVANLALEEGNTKRSIQLFNQALELDGLNAFAYHNLSLAFDLSRRFQEGDQARARAREIAGRGVAEEGLRGLDPRVRYPRLTRQDVIELVEGLSADQMGFVGSQPLSLDPMKQLGSRISLVFLVGAFLGLAALLVRLRIYPPAKECSKCGKVYRLESGFGESTVHCSQCVSVFMKREVVSIEQQTAKMNQIRRWEGWSSLVRRIIGFLIPGSHHVLDGNVIRGFLTGFLAWFFLVGALVLVPLFVPRIEPLAEIHSVQTTFLVFFGLIVLRSGVSAWSRR